MNDDPVIGHTLRGNRYLNVTSRCTLRCAFCPKFNGEWTVQDFRLRLHAEQEPDAKALLAAAGEPGQYREGVFCGLGEPSLRLYTVLEVGGCNSVTSPGTLMGPSSVVYPGITVPGGYYPSRTIFRPSQGFLRIHSVKR